MSAKVSVAGSASAGANVTGGKAASPTGAPGGNGGSDGASATAGARSAAGSGANPGTGSGTGGGGRFSSAMADAAHAGAHTADAPPSKPSAEGTTQHTTPASPTVIATNPEIDDEVLQLQTQVAARPNSSPPGASGNAGTGKAGAKSNAGARDSENDTAPVAPTEPVVLAMLLAASGLQLSSSGGATDSAAGAVDTDGDGHQAAIPVTRLAARIIAGLPASDAGAATAIDPAASAGPAVSAVLSAATNRVSAATAAATVILTGSSTAAVTAANATGAVNSSTPPATAAPTVAPDATNSAPGGASTTSTTSGDADAADKSALSSARSAIADTTPAQPSIMTDSSGLPELVRSFAGSATQAPSVQATISVPVANGDWPHAVAAQVHWFVNNDIQSATLRLSPEHLGPVEVRIDVHDSQVNVNFSAAHADTRAALEQTVPRLREIFASGGLTLGQANVRQDPRPGSQPAANPARPAFTATQAVEPVAVATAQGLGLVDEYA
jgi:flagellar hook-length control protein FliK